MYQQENHMYETAELDTEVFRAPNARGFTSLDDMEREREDPELYISTRPFDAGTLRQMVALATQKAAPVREIPAEPSELEQRARDFARAKSAGLAGSNAKTASTPLSDFAKYPQSEDLDRWRPDFLRGISDFRRGSGGVCSTDLGRFLLI